MNPYRRYIHHLDPSRQMMQEDRRSLKTLGYDDQTVGELDRLFGSYETEVYFGARHPAPCSAWRSERIQLANEELPRFANHVHVYSKSDGEAHGRYLGFVSLRPKMKPQAAGAGYKYTAIAYIAPPRYMLRPRYHVITYPGGPAEGVLPFRCSPFCVPNPITKNRASCLHAAVHQALLLTMSRFGSVPISSQDMMAILWTDPPDPEADFYDALREKGANLNEAYHVLRHKDVRAGAVREKFLARAHGDYPEAEKKAAFQEAHRCITDYLANGLPLIVAYPFRGTRPDRPDGHSVLLLGMHLMHDPEDPTDPLLHPYSATGANLAALLEAMELPGRFVIHDIGKRPYFEVSASKLFRDAWIDREKEQAGIYFLAVGPRHMEIGIRQVRKEVRSRLPVLKPDLWQQYFQSFRLGEPGDLQPESARLVTRLLQTSQLARRYLTGLSEEGRRPNGQALVALEAMTPKAKKEDRYWWCVEVRLPGYERQPERADHETMPLPPAMVFIWSVEDKPLLAEGALPAPRLTVQYFANGRAEVTAASGSPWEINYELLPA